MNELWPVSLRPLFETDHRHKKLLPKLALFLERNCKIICWLSNTYLSLHPLFDRMVLAGKMGAGCSIFFEIKNHKNLVGIAKRMYLCSPLKKIRNKFFISLVFLTLYLSSGSC